MVIIVVGVLDPFKKKESNRWELFNCFCQLVITCHLLCFTEFVQSNDAKIVVGYSLIAVTCLNILCNIAYLVVISVRSTSRFCRKLYCYKVCCLTKTKKNPKAASEPEMDKEEEKEEIEEVKQMELFEAMSPEERHRFFNPPESQESVLKREQLLQNQPL